DADARLVVGSNNWVVSGAHTVSGKPLLSNDMHLGHQMPNLWYEAHLHCGDFDTDGVTLPGMPYVIVGHNRRLACGFTSLGATSGTRPRARFRFALQETEAFRKMAATMRTNGPDTFPSTSFYEKVIKVKADVAALLCWISRFDCVLQRPRRQPNSGFGTPNHH